MTLTKSNDVIRYHRVIENDSSPDVRRAVLGQIGASKRSVRLVLAATRDKAPAVRKEAYNYIKQKVEVTALKVEDRLKLLKEGLNDRDSGPRSAAVSMLCASHYPSLRSRLLYQ